MELPIQDITTRCTGAIFDSTRKKYVANHPEESVRQAMVDYLIHELGYPRSLVTLEETVGYGTLTKRVDIMVRARKTAVAVMVIECKAPRYKIVQKHVDQLFIYNSVIKAPYAVVTNGLGVLCFKADRCTKKYILLDAIPHFSKLG